MASKQDNNDDDSFIILGTSPGTSLDVKCGSANGDVQLDKSNLEDALKDLSDEANMAYKAHFQLGDCVSVYNKLHLAKMNASILGAAGAGG